MVLVVLAVMKDSVDCCLGPGPSRGSRGEGADGQYPKQIAGFGPVPARIRPGARGSHILKYDFIH
jgi:hypothetical protein